MRSHKNSHHERDGIGFLHHICVGMCRVHSMSSWHQITFPTHGGGRGLQSVDAEPSLA